MSIAEVKTSADQKMLKAMESLKTSLSRIRTGRAHIGILDHIHVDYYGSSVPIGQVANITLIDARTLGVAVWEKKLATTVEKAIRDSGLGLNPMSMGELIRIPMPPLSEERRRELTKVAKSEGEHARVGVRGLRREANEQLKKLLKDKPKALGLTVPDMPVGSPGMDGPEYKGRKDAYDVLLVTKNLMNSDVSTKVFTSYRS